MSKLRVNFYLTHVVSMSASSEHFHQIIADRREVCGCIWLGASVHIWLGLLNVWVYI